MKYPWAVPGAKVAYIGTNMLMMLRHGEPGELFPSPLSGEKVYTIAAVSPWPGHTGLFGVELVERPRSYFDLRLFRPIQDKDQEMFNEWLTELLRDLIIDDLAERIFENQE